jgi:4-hydroxy-tetrahydrodipicolinate reductase
VAGCHHSAEARTDGRPIIRLAHPQQIDPKAEGVRTGDFVHIEGDPSIHMSISPEIEGGQGTAARMVNAVEGVLNAPSGLRTLDELGLLHLTRSNSAGLTNDGPRDGRTETVAG